MLRIERPRWYDPANTRNARILLLVALSLTGCRDDVVPPEARAPAALSPPEPVSELYDGRTISLRRIKQPQNLRPKVYEDDEYGVWCRDYGSGGVHTPGIFVHRNADDTWMEIARLSTRGAKLGRSPRAEEGGDYLSTNWNHAGLKAHEFVRFPRTAGAALMLPDEVAFDGDRGVYLLRFNARLSRMCGVDAVLTEFVAEKQDLDQAFAFEEPPSGPARR